MINWKMRGARVLGSFITGYSGGIGVTFPMSAIVDDITLNFIQIITLPAIAGLIAMLPQAGKIVNEFGRGNM